MGYQYIPTDQDIRVLKQRIKNVSIKINILNKDLATIDSLIGQTISDNYSINVDSDIRRTYNLTLNVSKDYDILSIYKKIWIDKLFQIFLGVEDLSTSEILWYPFGVFTFDQATYTINDSSYTLQLNCIDLVALLNGTLSGQISGTGLIIPAYDEDKKQPNKIRDVLINTVTQLGGIKKYNIDNMDKEIPYDLEFGVGSTIWEVITTLRDLYPGWETFFDVDGTFICQPIPTTEDDPVLLDEQIFKGLVIDEVTGYDMSTIRNITKIFGRTLDTDYYTDEVSTSSFTSSSNIYLVAPDDIDLFSIPNLKGVRTTFINKIQVPNNFNNLYMYIKNKTEMYKLNILKNEILENTFYYVRWHYDYSNNSLGTRENWFEIPNNYFVSNQITYEERNNNDIKELYYKITINENEFNYFTKNEENTSYINYLILKDIPKANETINKIYLQINDEEPFLISTKIINTNNMNDSQIASYQFKEGNTYILNRKIINSNQFYDDIEEFSSNNIINNTTSNFTSKITYTAQINSLTLKNNTLIGIKIPSNSTASPLLNLNGITYNLTDIDGQPLNDSELISNKSYVFNYSNTSNTFILQGQWQIMAIAKETKRYWTEEEKEQDKINESCDNIVYITNPNSPYTIEDIGELRQILSGNEYDNIYADDLAIQRAEYENWKATRLNDTITLNIISIPWLVGNEKISYSRQRLDTIDNYIVKQISGSITNWTQTLTLSKFYPLYPYIVN